MSDWRPIESAPTRTRVLVLCGPSIYVAENRAFGWATVPGRYAVHPTHWLPLPDLPAEKVKNQPPDLTAGEFNRGE